MTSPDGINWTIRTSAADNNWFSVAYGNGLFVAVAYTGTGNRVMTSGKHKLNIVPTNNIYQGGIDLRGILVGGPNAITATSETVAASIDMLTTEITTNGDSDLDNVSLANGVDGQIKVFAIVAVGNAADSVKITPATMIGGTQITFAANPLGLGCIMHYSSGAGWLVIGNNGGTIA